MISVVLLLVLQVDPEYETAVLDPLPYLARHQAYDGSWGSGLDKCTCGHALDPLLTPKEININEATKKKVLALIGKLGSSSLDERESAERELIKIGRKGVLQLHEASKSKDAEVRMRAGNILKTMSGVRYRSETRLTAASLLAFLGAGYFHLSKDTHDGICFGDVVRTGLIFLMKRQYVDGSFGTENAVTNAMAALALSEAYGRTRAKLFKEQALRAVRYVGKSKEKGTEFLVWKGLVLMSANNSGLGKGNAAKLHELSRILAGRKGEFALAGSVLFADKPDGESIKKLTALKGGELDHQTLFVAGVALFSIDGHRSPAWKSWKNNLKRPYRTITTDPKRRLCARGSWKGASLRDRISRTAFNALTVEIYYRYACVLRNKRR